MSTVCSGGSRPAGKGGGRSSRPCDKGGGEGRSQNKFFFRPFGPQFGLIIRGPLGPLPWILHWFVTKYFAKLSVFLLFCFVLFCFCFFVFFFSN